MISARPSIRELDAEAADGAPGEQGFALLLVIWVLALLALLAAGLAADSRSEIRRAANRGDLARVRALADAGVTIAIAWLIEPDKNTRWPADGTARIVHYGDGVISVAVQDEGGKVNLNAAPLDLVAGVLRKAGIDSDEAGVIVAGIDARRRAFAPQTVLQSMAAFNSPFAALPELRLVSGVTRRNYELARPFLTVYGENSTVNPMTATEKVLLGVPGISPQDVEFFLSARNHLPAGEPDADMPSLSGAARYVAVNDISVVTITARATDSRTSFTRAAVIALGAAAPAAQPYRVLDWEQSYIPLSGEPAGADN